MRDEQGTAVEKTFDYYQSIWKESKNAAPRFLWNAKMRFGKTFTAYQLAKKIKAKRILVVTFKPAVEFWQTRKCYYYAKYKQAGKFSKIWQAKFYWAIYRIDISANKNRTTVTAIDHFPALATKNT